ncbi:MAG: hypothetical protein M3495_07835 [Pseudomonadota bacterium]|nr:hypothetical protein [Gammaproteobacteria bacterium]MDQ3581517.1 hypothetical protein [Pseudomonadota bacterium]
MSGLLGALGSGRLRYYERFKRQACERIRNKTTRGTQSVPLPEEERDPLYAFSERHTEIGYRKLTWMTID